MNTTPDDDRLREAWAAFCDRLKEAGEVAFREQAPATPLDRATGLQYVARFITKSLLEKLEFTDPERPQLWTLQTPTHKSFGDNPDCTYLVARIDGAQTYRIVGNRGTVKWVSFMACGSALNNADLQVEWDGSFELWLSPDEHPGNWIKTAPIPNPKWTASYATGLFIRQFFGNWDTEEPMRIRIEWMGGDSAPPAPLTPDQIIDRLHAAAEWIVQETTYFGDFIDFYRDRPNRFVTGLPGDMEGAQASLGRLLHFCFWQVEPDEALVVRVTPPRCFYWNFELNNTWMTSVDYRYRLSSLNSEQATYEDDGSVVVVVSHRDPGIPNWLDTGGHTEGMINQRWLEATESSTPQAQLVRFDNLAAVLGDDVRRITPEQRREQLRRRKAGVDRRFPA